VGAGFYLDATAAPWAAHWRMESYLMRRAAAPAVEAQLPRSTAAMGIFGHSMGGHGALTLALRHPGVFKPACRRWRRSARRCSARGATRPSPATWAMTAAAWAAHDASALMAPAARPTPGHPDRPGLADKFLAEQLHPQAFEAACAAAGQPLTLRRHAGYDHGY
jgi:S-formylglutathione hydrolase